jgi:hypothetical protein
MTVWADVANENQMLEVIAQAEERFGEINGVIHAAVTITEALIQPQLSSFRLLLWYLQSFLPPDPFHPPVIHWTFLWILIE